MKKTNKQPSFNYIKQLMKKLHGTPDAKRRLAVEKRLKEALSKKGVTLI